MHNWTEGPFDTERKARENLQCGIVRYAIRTGLVQCLPMKRTLDCTEVPIRQIEGALIGTFDASAPDAGGALLPGQHQ
jgi:hypothetical protein